MCQVRKTVRSYDGILPALVAFSNVDPASVSPKDLKRADAVCLLGLQRLAKCSKRGDKTQMLVAALLKLLRRGIIQTSDLCHDSEIFYVEYPLVFLFWFYNFTHPSVLRCKAGLICVQSTHYQLVGLKDSATNRS